MFSSEEVGYGIGLKFITVNRIFLLPGLKTSKKKLFSNGHTTLSSTSCDKEKKYEQWIFQLFKIKST